MDDDDGQCGAARVQSIVKKVGRITKKILLEKMMSYDLDQVLSSAGKMDAVSQMPVVLLPIHFDRCFFINKSEQSVDFLKTNLNLCSQYFLRSQLERVPSCCRSVVIRPFRLNINTIQFVNDVDVGIQYDFYYTIFGPIFKIRCIFPGFIGDVKDPGFHG